MQDRLLSSMTEMMASGEHFNLLTDVQVVSLEKDSANLLTDARRGHRTVQRSSVLIPDYTDLSSSITQNRVIALQVIKLLNTLQRFQPGICIHFEQLFYLGIYFKAS